MIVLITLALVLVPAAAVLYPFLRRGRSPDSPEDETSPRAEMERRWDAALAGIRTAELERAVGSLTEDDYRWLRDRYMTDAAVVMKSMELEEREEARDAGRHRAGDASGARAYPGPRRTGAALGAFRNDLYRCRVGDRG